MYSVSHCHIGENAMFRYRRLIGMRCAEIKVHKNCDVFSGGKYVVGNLNLVVRNIIWHRSGL
jgi:hypothetical protein